MGRLHSCCPTVAPVRAQVSSTKLIRLPFSAIPARGSQPLFVSESTQLVAFFRGADHAAGRASACRQAMPPLLGARVAVRAAAVRRWGSGLVARKHVAQPARAPARTRTTPLL